MYEEAIANVLTASTLLERAKYLLSIAQYITIEMWAIPFWLMIFIGIIAVLNILLFLWIWRTNKKFREFLRSRLLRTKEVAKFIKKRGEGIMLISLNVDNTREAMDELQEKDYPFIGGARPFRDCEFAFVHPKKMNGVLLELIDYKWREFEDR